MFGNNHRVLKTVLQQSRPIFNVRVFRLVDTTHGLERPMCLKGLFNFLNSILVLIFFKGRSFSFMS